jgi:hypothetical protein
MDTDDGRVEGERWEKGRIGWAGEGLGELGAAEAFDVKAAMAEVEEEADGQAGGLQVVQALGGEQVMVLLDRLQFHNDETLDDQVGDEIAHEKTIVMDRYWSLLVHAQPAFPQFMGEGVLLYLFQKPASQGVRNLKCATNDLSRQLIQTFQPFSILMSLSRFPVPDSSSLISVSICVHLWLTLPV